MSGKCVSSQSKSTENVHTEAHKEAVERDHKGMEHAEKWLLGIPYGGKKTFICS